MSMFRITVKVLMVISVTGCSSVKFYDVSEGVEKNAGFLYYPPKPYVLIEQSKDTVSTKLISFPDLSKPHRIKQSGGFGSVELGFETDNGMIKTFNSTTDPKTAEVVTSLAGLGTAKAAIDTAAAALLATELTLVPTTSAEGFRPATPKYNVVVFVESIEKIEQKVIVPLESTTTKELFKSEVALLKAQVEKLTSNSFIEYESNKPDILINEVEKRRKISKEIANELNNTVINLTAYGDNVESFPSDFSVAKNAALELSKVVKKLNEYSLRSNSVVGLYEIQYIEGKLVLRKVAFK